MSEHNVNNETTCDREDTRPTIASYYNKEDDTATCTIKGSTREVTGMLACIFEAMYKKSPRQTLIILEQALDAVLHDDKEEQDTDVTE